MKRKIFYALAFSLLLMCLFAFSAFAAATNEFGTVEKSQTIDLSGMASDTDTRVVLFDGTEYHTYPSQYIVTSATDITFNFNKINEAFGKSYQNNSVVRIEVPRHVLKIDSGEFNYGKNNNLLEVFFPADSNLKEIAWGAFENNSSLQKINFPRSLQNISNNAFCKCTSLTDILFAEDSTITEIKGEKVFYQCSSLEVLVFPNSLVKIGASPFGVAPKLKTVVLGANMETLPGAMSDITPKGTVIYFSEKFYAPSVTTEPGANMFHWAGANGINNNPKYLTFVYTGTKEQAQALQARFGKVDGLQRLSEATLCSVSEYKELTGLEVGVGAQTGNFLIYGYNKCEAFYGGKHTISNDTELKFEGAEYTSRYVSVCACTNGCGKDVVTEICGPLFYNKGYSKGEIGGVGYIDLGIVLYKENVELYEKATGNKINYGFVVGDASKDSLGGKLFDENGALTLNGAITTDFSSLDFNVFSVYNLKLTGIATDAQKDLDIYACTYVIENGTAKYIANTVTDTAKSIDYISLPSSKDE